MTGDAAAAVSGGGQEAERRTSQSLLAATHYGNPRYRRSLRTPVFLDVTVSQLWHADIRTESFLVELKIRARWLCPPEHASEALQHRSDALDWDWEPEWIPRITVDNATERISELPRAFAAWREGAAAAAASKAAPETDRSGAAATKETAAPMDGLRASGSESTWIAGEWTFAVKVFEKYDLRDFPFDLQDFNIYIRVDNAPSLELRSLVRSSGPKKGAHLARDDEEAVRVNVAGCQVSGFQPLNVHDRGGEDRPDAGCVEQRLALYRLLPSDRRVHIVLLYEREARFYRVNYILLLAAIAAAAIVSWSVQYYDLGSRLGLDVTLLLTSVAFKQVLAGTVPPIKYLTLLDVYAFGSFAFLILATFMHAAIGWVIDECDADGECTYRVSSATKDRVRDADEALLWVYVAFFFAANGVYAAHVSRRRGLGRKYFSWAAARAQGFRAAGLTLPKHRWHSAGQIDKES